ncbi:MAG: PTS system nitrogen regulatory IIA component [Candidatus Azotimanducaceae bacterium]
MNIEDILTADRTYCKIVATSRKRALEEIAHKLAATIEGLSAEQLFSRLIAREKMGSTALGHGIAIPHCRIAGCPKIVGGLVSLSDAIDFEAYDQAKVQVMFVLIVPEEEINEHLSVLAMLAKRFESDTYREALFAANSASALYQAAIANPEPSIKQANQ